MLINLEKNKSFCILPFSHLHACTDGRIKLCCRSLSQIGNIQKDSIKNIWNSYHMKNTRQKMLNGEKVDMCQPCWDLESKGVLSLRQRMNKNRKHLFYKLNDIHPDFSIAFNIPVIALSLSNLCNLRCRMCNPNASTSWLKDWNKIKDVYEYESIGTNYYVRMKLKKINYFDQESFFKNIKLLGPHLEILEFVGGEPLMDPTHYKVLKTISPWAKNIQLKYSTNLSRLKTGHFDALKEWSIFKNLDLSLSVDGYPELNEYIRTDSKTEELVYNLKKVKNSVKKLTLRASLCLSVYNVLRLPESYDWITRVLEVPVHGNHVTSPVFLNSRILPFEIKQSLSKKFTQYIKHVKKGMYSAYPKEWSERIIRFTANNLKYTKSDDLHKQWWPKFIEHTKRLDNIRNTDILKILNELKPYF